MSRKRYSDEGVLRLLREIELNLTSGHGVASACRSARVSDATYYNWRIVAASRHRFEQAAKRLVGW